MDLDLRHVPFSRYGSYLAFSQLPQQESRPAGLYLRTVHGNSQERAMARVELLKDGQAVPFQTRADACRLRLETDGGLVEICFAEPQVLRVRGNGTGLRLVFTPGRYAHAFPLASGRWQVNRGPFEQKLMLTSLNGHWQGDAPWQVDRCERLVMDLIPVTGEATCEGAIEEFACTWHPRGYAGSFGSCLAAVETEFVRWVGQAPALPPEYGRARELAAYVNWSSVVAPNGMLKRPGMYMSKNWMNNIWSWDHCFNALALAAGNPALAWDQLMILFDHQDADGALPDSINDGAASWAFNKPPIHGWTLLRLLERGAQITTGQLRELYEPLRLWTEWWLTFRDHDADGLPDYHHGNDSGWDNCTVFEAGLPLEAPDLSAFLILQMEALAIVAGRLGNDAAAGGWRERAQHLLQRLLAHFWRGDQFMAMRSGDHRVVACDSLLPYLPLILGKRLPAGVRAALVAGLTRPGRFITEHGLATESPQSPLYQADGYWRGPIWAPSTMLIAEGLAAIGEKCLARQICHKFCNLAARSGMAENYDALTGAGLRDRAYTWTSSVFLILGHECLRGAAGH